MLIYMATVVQTGKSYIGLTTKSLAQRKYGHHRDAMVGKLYPFHCAIRKYGKDSIVWVVLEDSITDFKQLCEREQYWIKLHKTLTPQGYNLTYGGEGAYGHVVTDEAKKRMGIANIGKPSWNKGKTTPKEVRNKIGLANRGRKHGDAFILKMTEINRARGIARRGTPRSPETIEKMRAAATGKIVSVETRLKLSAASRARVVSESTREKIRQIRLGKKHTEATKLKCRLSNKGMKPWNTGKKHSAEAIENMRKAHLGTKQSEVTKLKRSLAMRGHPNWNLVCSEETKKKIGLANKGKQLTEVHKLKIKESWVIRKQNKG